MPVTQSSTPAAKIALFRSLFRGREDVYARRFLAEDVGKRLDTVLDGILAAMAFCRRKH